MRDMVSPFTPGLLDRPAGLGSVLVKLPFLTVLYWSRQTS